MPSMAELADPVQATTRDRIGAELGVRDGATRSAAATAEIARLLAAPLDADGAVAIALLASPALAAELDRLGLAGAELARATTPRNPEVELILREPLGAGARQLELVATQSLSDLLTLLGRRSSARAGLEGAQRLAAAHAIALAARVRIAFADVLAAQAGRDMTRTVRATADAGRELADSLAEAGNLSELARAEQQAFYEEAVLADEQADLVVDEARERIDRLLGLSGGELGWSTAATLAALPATPPDLATIERDAVAASLALEAARWEMVAAGRAIGVARVDSVMPDLAVGVAAQREAGEWGVGPALIASLPLFDWGQAERGAAWARLRRAQHGYEDRAVRLRSAARQVRHRLELAYRRATHLRDVIVPLEERMVAESVRHYNAMAASPFELLARKRHESASRADYLVAVRDYWAAHFEIEALRAGATLDQEND